MRKQGKGDERATLLVVLVPLVIKVLVLLAGTRIEGYR